jgi:hypothetical protein
MKSFFFTLLALLFVGEVSAQVSLTSADKEIMLSVVNDGLSSNPKTFFNKGTDYDYATNIVVSSVSIPEKQTFTGFEDRDAATFFCKVDYTVEGISESNYFKIMTRRNTVREFTFYSATLWSEENVK